MRLLLLLMMFGVATAQTCGDGILDVGYVAQSAVLPAGLDGNDYFGWSSAWYDGWLAVGSPYTGSATSGKVFLFQETSPGVVENTTHVLTSTSANTDGQFGFAMDLRGIRLCVGSPYEAGGLGGAHLFEYNGTDWELVYEHFPSTGTYLGYDCSVDGDFVAYAGFSLGVHVVHWNGTAWEFSQLITDPVPQFGITVAARGGVMAIGTNLETGTFVNEGSVSIYTLQSSNEWQFLERLRHPNPTLGCQFGWHVDLEDNFLVVSSYAWTSNQGNVVGFARDATNHFTVETELQTAGSSQMGYRVRVAGRHVMARSGGADELSLWFYNETAAAWEAQASGVDVAAVAGTVTGMAFRHSASHGVSHFAVGSSLVDVYDGVVELVRLPESCDDAGAGQCGGDCQLSYCGDGYVLGAESCDDQNLLEGDSCLTSCVSAFCGDGFVHDGVEACDDGDADNSNDCLASCELPTCGDGFVWNAGSGTEQCDDSDADETNDCLSTCVNATCGDGFVWSSGSGVEECDDADTDQTNACLNTCLNATCGDGFLFAGIEECDDASATNTSACLSTCFNATCGDGFVHDGVEECDDGDSLNSNSCLTSCFNATCGDGFVFEGQEACDDGANGNQTDSCLDSCVAASCGDSFVFLGVEACDDGDLDNANGCTNACGLPTCGDSIVQAGEQCDDGDSLNSNSCLNSCFNATCGDGFVLAGQEQCDDANSDNQDLCLNSCFTATCGDSVLHAGVEECDDGDGDETNNCLSSCILATCGDGVVHAGVEQW